MAIKSQKDLLAGLMFTLTGAAFTLGAREYDMGTAGRMGPGYFPLVLGIILAGLGILITLQSLAGNDFCVKRATMLSAILTIGSYLIFVKMLGLTFQVWPWFIGA